MFYQPHEGGGYEHLATHEIKKNASGLVEHDKETWIYLFIYLLIIRYFQ